MASPWFYGGPLANKIRTGLQVAEHMVDLLFVHGDADKRACGRETPRDCERGWRGRRHPTLGRVVPVRMTEAWLILDEAAIRTARGKSERSDSSRTANTA